jgi:hypothetical protein
MPQAAQAGASLAEIRATLGLSDTTLRRLIREHDVPPANPEAAALRRSASATAPTCGAARTQRHRCKGTCSR